jgi:stress response protein SCP2
VGAAARLAIECDGDYWHGPDAYQRDMARQRELERVGWSFVRVLESDFVRDPTAALAPLWDRLTDLDIHPSGWIPPAEPPIPESSLATGRARARDAEVDVHAMERPDHPRTVVADATLVMSDPIDDGHQRAQGLPAHSTSRGHGFVELAPYPHFDDQLPPAPEASQEQLIEGLARIVAVEGPIVEHRLHTAYGKAAGHRRMGPQITKELTSAVSAAARRGLLIQDPPDSSGIEPRTFRLPYQPDVVLRELGPRDLDQVPRAELAEVMRQVAAQVGWEDTEAVVRTTMAEYGIRRMGGNIRATLMATVGLDRDAAQQPDGPAPAAAQPIDTVPPHTNLATGQDVAVAGDRIAVRIHWSTDSPEPDACAFLLTTAGRVRSDSDFIFYNQPASPDGSVRIANKTTTDMVTTGGIDIDLNKIAPDVARVFLAVSIDSGSFSDIHDLRITITSASRPDGIELRSHNGKGAVLLFAELYRSAKAWRLREAHRGNDGDLAGLARSVGVDVS